MVSDRWERHWNSSCSPDREWNMSGTQTMLWLLCQNWWEEAELLEDKSLPSLTCMLCIVSLVEWKIMKIQTIVIILHYLHFYTGFLVVQVHQLSPHCSKFTVPGFPERSPVVFINTRCNTKIHEKNCPRCCSAIDMSSSDNSSDCVHLTSHKSR